MSEPRLRLLAMLDEVGGHIDARLRHDHAAVENFRGPRHFSVVPGENEVWGHCSRPTDFSCVFIHFDGCLLEEAADSG